MLRLTEPRRDKLLAELAVLKAIVTALPLGRVTGLRRRFALWWRFWKLLLWAKLYGAPSNIVAEIFKITEGL